MPDPKNRLPWNVAVKPYPATADLQAIESFVRVYTEFFNVGVSYTQLLYTVPAGKILCLQLINLYCNEAAPTATQLSVQVGADYYIFDMQAYGGAWSQNLYDGNLLVNALEVVQCYWAGTTATSGVYGKVFGYLMDKY